MAELVEGAPLLREYGVKNSIEGSNPSLSAIHPGSADRFSGRRGLLKEAVLDSRAVSPQNRRLTMRP